VLRYATVDLAGHPRSGRTKASPVRKSRRPEIRACVGAQIDPKTLRTECGRQQAARWISVASAGMRALSTANHVAVCQLRVTVTAASSRGLVLQASIGRPERQPFVVLFPTT
jgi:hypothetical protein